ncbi:hypothetical protein O6H91_08G070500 [Diphasiastrum complanatum]|uniref:Uncharacterized protein n=1 Tax=Diphasiastrum complanatum TaxID=34168 RepID=A0ACC2CYN2_DIPCM|nr:hypothetical protein O6H91_Y517700 [Diphasiastrum complanatum]KAJ7547128.1 hypothetical protein O6H91_08G070500 [Diphasiastrum complanatum]
MLLYCLAVVLGALLLVTVSKLVRNLWWRPLCVRSVLEAQGVKGPPPKLLVGNQPAVKQMLQEVSSTPLRSISHDIVPWILPHYERWSKIYGETFLFWWGMEPRLTISDPDLIKEILSIKFGHFPKLPMTSASKDLFGDGLVTSNGERWAQERRLLNQAFHAERLKDMAETMTSLTVKMLNAWKNMLGDAQSSIGVEIEIQKQYTNLTADIIAHTAFGTSYEVGKVVFSLQYEQSRFSQEANRSLRWPGQSFLPTAKNRYRWKIRKRIEEKLHQMIQIRLEKDYKTGENAQDLLGLMVSAYRGLQQGNSQRHLRMSTQNIVDQCKTFFFAGHETTAALLTWTTLLLAINPEWQERLRTEIFAVCGSKPPNSDMLNSLKLVAMVLYEALRLYPAATTLLRCTCTDLKLGKLLIPKGTTLFLPVVAVLHSKEMWGEDANEFKPERFCDGIANAVKNQSAYLPFSLGPRNCIGQGFALMEAKIVLALLLQSFRFELSPSYVHAPSQVGIVKPLYGMQILLQPYP